jgi:hypothetical protein
MIGLEVSRPEVRESVILAAMAVIGVPGVAVGARSVIEATRQGGTDAPPSPPAAEESPPQLSS